MEERTEEGKIKGAIDLITLEKTEKISEQMKTCICKVYGNLTGTGFFCKIQYENMMIPVLITNYHIISDEYLKNSKQIKISINNEKIYDIININENSKIYSSIKDRYDIMIIKLEEEKDIYQYLEFDEQLFYENVEKIYEEKSIYILHYPNADKVSVSFGYGIQKLDAYSIKHFCNTQHCSSGSPILNLKTNKVVGIHSGAINNKNKERKCNIGILLKYPLNELKTIKKKEIRPKNVNEIKLTVNINKDDINSDIYFLITQMVLIIKLSIIMII